MASAIYNIYKKNTQKLGKVAKYFLVFFLEKIYEVKVSGIVDLPFSVHSGIPVPAFLGPNLRFPYLPPSLPYSIDDL